MDNIAPPFGGDFTVRTSRAETGCVHSDNRSGKPCKPPLTATRLPDQVRERIRHLHYSLRTEQAYVRRIRQFIRRMRSPACCRHPPESSAGCPVCCAGRACCVPEGLRPRVKDLDFERGLVVVRECKGGKDRAWNVKGTSLSVCA